MKLNAVERVLMNNPVRAAIQRHVEAAHFERMGGKLHGLRVLEIGCGRGVGTEILLERFLAAEVHAFDLDSRMVLHTRRRLRNGPGVGTFRLFVADAARIPASRASYDAVIDFGAIHHVPDWRMAVAEVQRILRPGGRFYFLEVSRLFLDRWMTRTFLDHPRDDRFTMEEFIAELEERAIRVEDRLMHRLRGAFFAGVGVAGSALQPTPPAAVRLA
jgi:ubiquinone/menaquinone biosynthesis C-methylase UbiE